MDIAFAFHKFTLIRSNIMIHHIPFAATTNPFVGAHLARRTSADETGGLHGPAATVNTREKCPRLQHSEGLEIPESVCCGEIMKWKSSDPHEKTT